MPQAAGMGGLPGGYVVAVQAPSCRRIFLRDAAGHAWTGLFAQARAFPARHEAEAAAAPYEALVLPWAEAYDLAADLAWPAEEAAPVAG